MTHGLIQVGGEKSALLLVFRISFHLLESCLWKMRLDQDLGDVNGGQTSCCHANTNRIFPFLFTNKVFLTPFYSHVLSIATCFRVFEC